MKRTVVKTESIQLGHEDIRQIVVKFLGLNPATALYVFDDNNEKVNLPHFDLAHILKEEQEIDTVKLLSKKLNQAIMDEKYEDAAKIRDLIKSLEEDKK
jgi:excinuclease UvrABC helicase subunit UvrB